LVKAPIVVEFHFLAGNLCNHKAKVPEMLQCCPFLLTRCIEIFRGQQFKCDVLAAILCRTQFRL